MGSQTQPFVSIVTPVYNGERYLAECIESILAQTYTHWRYTIVNNCSIDRSLEIAASYAQRDVRITVHTNPTFLGMLQNWNAAMRLIDPQSAYCKVVHADDLLLPECLSRMVALAEAHSTVGIVGAYRIRGDHVDLDGLPYERTVFTGAEVCRTALLRGLHVFGSPSSILIRADLVRSRKLFYNEANLHADTEVCYDLLRNCDFGFVHQVLTYTRSHAEQVSSYACDLNTYAISHLHHLLTYGPTYLSADEYHQRLQTQLTGYYRFLAWNVLHRREATFWAYHRIEMVRLGLPLQPIRLAQAVVAFILNRILNPKQTLEGKLQKRASYKRYNI